MSEDTSKLSSHTFPSEKSVFIGTECPEFLRNNNGLEFNNCIAHFTRSKAPESTSAGTTGKASNLGRYFRPQYQYPDSSEDGDSSEPVVPVEKAELSRKSSSSVKCPHCVEPNYFKNKNGVKIHISRMHTQVKFSQSQVATSNDFQSQLCTFRSTIQLIKRIPRSARSSVANKLASVIKKCVSCNTEESWEELFLFAYRILHVTKKKQKDIISLSQKIKDNVSAYILPTDIKTYNASKSKSVYKLAENKISNGEIRSAVRILSSDDTLAPNNAATFEELKAKHPPPSRPLQFPAPPPENHEHFTTNEDLVLQGIMSFQCGSAAGIDGISPQHLKDLISKSAGDSGPRLLSSITDLCNFMLSGKVNQNFTQFLYGASLCALKKKDGGIRPIAIGSCFRRLVSKLGCRMVSEQLADYFSPNQLGFSIKGGCEAAVHSVRTYVRQNQTAEVLLKLDVRNAFNSVERDILCNMIIDKIPKLYPYLWQCYGSHSKLFFNEKPLESCVGCQQGDPLGPAIFSLAIHPIIENLKSDLNIWYLDDGTLAGSRINVLTDLKTVLDEFQKIGLNLNFSKSELYFCPFFPSKFQEQTLKDFSSLAPGIRVVSDDNLFILGSPVLETGMPPFFEKLLSNFSLLASNVMHIHPHMALHILRHCFWIPKFNYYLRCCPFWKFNSTCETFDTTIRSVLENIINIKFSLSSWQQASLPIAFGGLGIRSVLDVSLPAFLSSLNASLALINSILSPSLVEFDCEFSNEAMLCWSREFPNTQEPDQPKLQKSWDLFVIKKKYDSLLANADAREKAVLLAAANKESGAWLEALPSSQIGTLLDKHSLQIAVALRVRSAICHPHVCVCGSDVDHLGHHGLSCNRSAGRISRHNSLNDILKRAFISSDIPCILEPAGLFRDDGKRPDGVTLIPWKKGQCLAWDVTCVDTVAPSHVLDSSSIAGSAANSAEHLKHSKYKAIKESHFFCAFAVETLGPWSQDAKYLYNELGHLLKNYSGVPSAKAFLRQRISIAIQRGNAASVLGTVPLSPGLDEVFLLF